MGEGDTSTLRFTDDVDHDEDEDEDEVDEDDDGMRMSEQRGLSYC